MVCKNGYKLLYQFIKENEKHIFGTKAAAPDFENDVALTYKAGGEDADLTGIKLVYFKDGCIYTSKENIPTANDQKVLVYIGEDLIIGEAD